MTETMDQSGVLAPFVVASDAGEARWWLGGLAVIKATASQTGGQVSIIEVTDPPGSEAVMHVHHRDDEGFWLLEGSATFEIGPTTIEASAGDYLFAPREIPHRYTVGAAGCRMLYIMTPGGFEDLVRATSDAAVTRTLPPTTAEEPDWQQLAAAIEAHGCELLD